MTFANIQTDAAPSAIGPYSQAFRAGDLVFCSGQIAIDPATGQLNMETLEEEIHQVMKNLAAVVKAAGADLSRVVKTTIFLKDLSSFEEVNRIYGEYFQPPYPARACVEVAKLPKDVRVEIDAIVKVF